MDIKEFKKLPVMGILRNISLSALETLIKTIIETGLKTIEITMNNDNALSLIEEVVKIAKGKLTIGAGTVLNRKELEQAIDYGASFVVTPVLVEEVNKYCVRNKIPVFPGALTPAEIYRAWEKGATMVKVFPAKVFGPSYFAEVKGPFNDIELMAVGGVGPENISQYFSNGASAVAFGASVFRKEWIDKKDFTSIGNCIKKYLDAAEKSVQ